MSYVRGKRTTHPNTSILKLEGVQTTEEAKYVELLPTRAERREMVVGNDSRRMIC